MTGSIEQKKLTVDFVVSASYNEVERRVTSGEFFDKESDFWVRAVEELQNRAPDANLGANSELRQKA